MSSIRPLRRLLRVLTLEEEQAKSAMEAALANLHQFQNALKSAVEREHTGRQLFAMSIHRGDSLDRLAALEEISAAERKAAVLRSRIEQVEKSVAELREEYLAKRVERRQAETLLREAEAREASELARRAQQSTDDWYLGRMIQRGQAEDDTSTEQSADTRRTT